MLSGEEKNMLELLFDLYFWIQEHIYLPGTDIGIGLSLVYKKLIYVRSEHDVLV